MQHTPKHLWIALWFVEEGETNIDLKLIPSFLGTRWTKNKTKIQECKKKIINFLGSFWNIISSPLMFDKVLWWTVCVVTFPQCVCMIWTTVGGAYLDYQPDTVIIVWIQRLSSHSSTWEGHSDQGSNIHLHFGLHSRKTRIVCWMFCC